MDKNVDHEKNWKEFLSKHTLVQVSYVERTLRDLYIPNDVPINDKTVEDHLHQRYGNECILEWYKKP